MVDRIEFKTTPIKEISTNCFRKSKYIRHNKNHSIFFNSSYFSFYLYKHDVEDLNDFEVKKMSCLYVTVRINKKQKGSIEISNSVRKWYYGKNSMRDFNFSDFLDCLQIIAERLNIDLSSILDSEIRLIELGANLKFLSKHQIILLSIFEHKNLKVRSTLYNNSTVYFNGVNKTIAVYDKLLERKEKNGLSDEMYKKLSKKYFYGRFELRVENISGTEVIEDKINTIANLCLNWDILVDYWAKEMELISVLELYSPLIEIGKIEKEIGLVNYYIYRGMKCVSHDEHLALLSSFYRDKPVQKYRVKKKLSNVYNEISSLQENNISEIIHEQLSKKVISLKSTG